MMKSYMVTELSPFICIQNDGIKLVTYTLIHFNNNNIKKRYMLKRSVTDIEPSKTLKTELRELFQQ